MRAAVREGVDPALDRALDILDCPPARHALAALLVDRSCAGELVRGSQLMSEGYPVELTFTSAAPSTIRWTADVEPPTTPPSARLGHLLGRLDRLGVDVPPSPVIELLARAQAGAVLRFGAWVGGRHDAAGDRYKLYVEVARDRADPVGRDVARVLGRPRRLLDTTPLRFVGLDLRSGAVEMYHRIGTSDRRHIEAMLAAECLVHRADDLLGALAEAADRPVGDRLPISNLAASVAVESHGETTVALFAHTVSILGRDLSCRERLMALASRRGLRLGMYPEVSAGLVDAPRGRRHHSMLTLAVTDAAPLHLGVGLRPPDMSPSDRRLPVRDRSTGGPR